MSTSIINKRGVLGVAVALGCFSIGLLYAQLSSDAEVKPYTVTGLTRDFTPSGELFGTEDFIKYVKSDGSYANWKTRTAVLEGRMVPARIGSIFNTALGQAVSVDEKTRSISTMPLTVDEVARLRTRKTGPCAETSENVTAEPASPVLGLPVTKVTTNLGTQNGRNIVVESWLTPELGCLSLLEIISAQLPDGNKQRMKITEISSVHQGEPESMFFEVPDGYTERTPGEKYRLFSEELGMECPDCVTGTLDRADTRYHEKRNAAGWK